MCFNEDTFFEDDGAMEGIASVKRWNWVIIREQVTHGPQLSR